jgi:hypothetical protein
MMRANSGDEAVRIFEAEPERVGILVAVIASYYGHSTPARWPAFFSLSVDFPAPPQ